MKLYIAFETYVNIEWVAVWERGKKGAVAGVNCSVYKLISCWCVLGRVK